MSLRHKVLVWVEILAAAAAFIGGSALVRYAHGQVMNDRTAADRNREWLAKSLGTGRVATIPIGTLYVNGTAVTRPINGCGRIATKGSGGYSMAPHATLSGFQSRIVQIGNGPILRLCGAGFIATDPIELVGDGISAAIEIEGRASPATGRHRFANLLFCEWGAAFKCLGGYYQDGQFVADENHADNCIVEGCETFNCRSLFRSENQQAVNWVFRDCVVNQLGPAQPFVCCDVVRGGCLTLERLVIEEPLFTLFRVADYSPNNCRLVSRDLYVDRLTHPGANFCWFEYAGDSPAPYKRWLVTVDGFAATQLKPLEQHEQTRNCDELPQDGIAIDIRHIVQGPNK